MLSLKHLLTARRRVCFCSCRSRGGIRISLVCHQAWPLKPVRELLLCFVSALRLCFHPRQSFYRSHRRDSGCTQKQKKQSLISCFSLLLHLLSSHPLLPLLFLPLDPSQSSPLSVCLWTRDEAEMEYLKIAQDLDMYGVNYFLIRVSHCCLVVSWQSQVM